MAANIDGEFFNAFIRAHKPFPAERGCCGPTRQQFNGDPAVVGRTAMLANALGGPATPTAHTIVGVLPRGFEFPDAQMQFWTPVPWTPRSGGWLIARLADDVSMPAAAAELEALLREIKREQRPAAFALTRVHDAIVEPVKPALLVLTLAPASCC